MGSKNEGFFSLSLVPVPKMLNSSKTERFWVGLDWALGTFFWPQGPGPGRDTEQRAVGEQVQIRRGREVGRKGRERFFRALLARRSV